MSIGRSWVVVELTDAQRGELVSQAAERGLTGAQLASAIVGEHLAAVVWARKVLVTPSNLSQFETEPPKRAAAPVEPDASMTARIAGGCC